jgi:hypothetical protein
MSRSFSSQARCRSGLIGEATDGRLEAQFEQRMGGSCAVKRRLQSRAERSPASVPGRHAARGGRGARRGVAVGRTTALHAHGHDGDDRASMRDDCASRALRSCLSQCVGPAMRSLLELSAYSCSSWRSGPPRRTPAAARTWRYRCPSDSNTHSTHLMCWKTSAETSRVVVDPHYDLD